MDKNTVLVMLDQERTAYMAFLELKRQVGDWPEVAAYAQKIMIVNEKSRKPQRTKNARRIVRFARST
jgi:hypothetical protein